MKTEPGESSSSSHTKQKRVDDEIDDEMFFDLRSDYIDNAEDDFDDMAEPEAEFIEDENEDGQNELFTVEEIDLDEIDGEEHIDDSDSEDCERILDDEFVRIPKKKIKLEPKIKKEKVETITNADGSFEVKKAGRGRKSKDEPETNICEICGNIYSKRSLLNMHMRRHRAEKPFECE